MECVFKFKEINKEGKKEFECEKCGYVTEYENVSRDCKPVFQPKHEPSLLRKIANFGMAFGKHLYKGMPTVEKEVLEKRLENCRECPLFKKNGLVGGVCTHENCGCNIQDEVVFLNKLAWADQECPIGKWGKIEK